MKPLLPTYFTCFYSSIIMKTTTKIGNQLKLKSLKKKKNAPQLKIGPGRLVEKLSK